MAELHLIILWEKARYLEKKILNDVSNRFKIIKIFEITWDKEYVAQNFTRFYGVNLPHNSVKEQECGSGPFLLITILDENPIYDYRDTSRGQEVVNTNLFDAKSKYREWTDGGHKIHATNNPEEFNHDITLLLGKNKDDFIKKYKNSSLDIEIIHSNIIGHNKWDSIEQLFYVLNNTINYVILRGKDELINHSFPESHRDVDLFIDNIFNAQYIINGQSVYSLSRPHELIQIDGYDYYFDLWDINRHYFDRKWSKNLLSTREYVNGFYILNPENDFYLLIYHCLIFKNKIAPDYLSILEKYLENSCLEYKSWDYLLLDYLSKNQYDILIPNDKSICITLKGILQDYANKYGKLIKTLESPGLNNTPAYSSKVYEKNNSFIKKGDSFLIDNEYKHLTELNAYPYFPKVLDYKTEHNNTFIEITRLEGTDFKSFFSNSKHQKLSYIKSFIKECFAILGILNKHGIIHRDFIPSNILIQENNNKCKVSLIDFGWAIKIVDLNNCIRPNCLGDKYAPPKGYSDFYSLGMLLNEQWEFLTYISQLTSSLKQIKEDDYLNNDLLNKKMNESLIISSKNITIRDYCRLLLIRYPLIKKIRSLFYH